MGMRLIDADALANALFDQRKNYPQWVADTIGNMPDVVVMCRDCKYSNPCDRQGFVTCNETFFEKGFVRPDWFCADGERRTDERTNHA